MFAGAFAQRGFALAPWVFVATGGVALSAVISGAGAQTAALAKIGSFAGNVSGVGASLANLSKVATVSGVSGGAGATVALYTKAGALSGKVSGGAQSVALLTPITSATLPEASSLVGMVSSAVAVTGMVTTSAITGMTDTPSTLIGWRALS